MREKHFSHVTIEEHFLKLQHEVQEMIDAPDDIEEWADVLIAYMNTLQMRGISLFSVLKGANKKTANNIKSEWYRNEDGTMSRVK